MNTKLAGCAMDENSRQNMEAPRQKALRWALENQRFFLGESPALKLIMEMEPGNQWDPNAIAVYIFSVTEGTRAQIGYLPNKGRICTVCGEAFPPEKQASDEVTVCTQCGGEVSRDGVASTIAQAVRTSLRDINDVYEITIQWEAGGITGSPSTYKGCNVRVQARPEQGA